MATDKANSQSAPQEDPVSQLGAIQNIIIGPAMAEFSKKLAETRAQMEEQDQQLSSNIQGLQDGPITDLKNELDALTKRFEAFEAMVNQKLSQLEHEKSTWEDMGNLIIQLGESVKKANQ